MVQGPIEFRFGCIHYYTCVGMIGAVSRLLVSGDWRLTGLGVYPQPGASHLRLQGFWAYSALLEGTRGFWRVPCVEASRCIDPRNRGGAPNLGFAVWEGFLFWKIPRRTFLRVYMLESGHLPCEEDTSASVTSLEKLLGFKTAGCR